MTSTEDLDQLRDQFNRFGAPSTTDHRTIVINLNQSDKWMRQADVFDKKITTSHTGQIFNKFKSKTLTYDQYSVFLKKLTESSQAGLDLVISKLISCGEPDPIFSEIPIYYDIDYGIYYYPWESFKDSDQIHPIIQAPRHLIYDFTTNWHYDPFTNGKYLSLKDSQEFEKLRENKSDVIAQKWHRVPIFFEVNQKTYFYPDCIGVNQVDPVVYITDTLPFDPGDKLFYNPNTLQRYFKLTNEEEYKKITKIPVCKNLGIHFHNEKFSFPKHMLQDEILIPSNIILGPVKKSQDYVRLKSPGEFNSLRIKTRQKFLTQKTSLLGKTLQVYLDPMSHCFYYPKVGINEIDLVSTQIKRKMPSFQFDEWSHTGYNPKNGLKYMEVANSEEFQDISQFFIKNQRGILNEILAMETPIYYNDTTKRFFYPESILHEENIVFRKVLDKPPTFVYEHGMYSHPATGKPYIEFKSPLELKKKKKIKLKSVPIYYDIPESFYPKNAIMEMDPMFVDALTEKPSLWSPPDDVRISFDILTGEEYCKVSQDELLEVGKKSLEAQLLREYNTKIDNAALYHDVKTNVYYFPDIPSSEIQGIPHKILFGKLRYCHETGLYHDPSTNKGYRVVDLEQALNVIEEAVKEATVSELMEEYKSQRRVYYDAGSKKYFYPFEGIESKTDNEILIKDKIPSLLFNDVTKRQFNPLTGDSFVVLNSLKDLEVLAELKQIRDLDVTKRLPIYIDQHGDFYYPSIAIHDDPSTKRKVRTVTTAPLVYHHKLRKYYDPQSCHEYRKTNALDVLEKAQYIKKAERKIIGLPDPITNTPIYYDPSSELLFYPKRMLFDKEIEEVFIFKKPVLDFIQKKGILIDILTDEEYISVPDPLAFEVLKGYFNVTQPEPVERFYFNEGGFYYPEIAFEEIMPKPRVLTIPDFKFIKYGELYSNPRNNTLYELVKTPEEFDKVRLTRIGFKKASMEVRKQQTQLPIYYDVNHKQYYFPQKMLAEFELKARVIVSGKPLIQADPRTKVIYDLWGKEEYVIFDSVFDFIQQRNRMTRTAILQKCRITRFQDYENFQNCISVNAPVYFDWVTGYYYVPQDIDGERKFRDVICGIPPLRYNPENKCFISYITGLDYQRRDNYI